MFKGNQLCQPLGDISTYDNVNGSSVNLSLTEAEANAGMLLAGNLLAFADNSEVNLAHVTGMAIGILTDNVDMYGTTGLEAFRKIFLGDQWNIPKKKGSHVILRCPRPHANSQCIFEGAGVAAINNFVITSGTGALSNATARHTLLSCHKGGLRIAQSGEFAFAILEQANLTPIVDESNVRIRVRFISPFKVA